MRKILLTVLLATLTHAQAEDWGRFRGPNGSGISDKAGLPVEFGLKKNMAWRTEVPFGRSSPVLNQNSLVITASEADKLVTLCLSLSDGKVLWRREIIRERTQKIFKGNDTATPTPATDGNNIYVFFPDFGLVSYDPAGGERWRMKLGPFDSFYGLASSPVIYGSTLVQVCDQNHGSFIIAVDKDTGRELWRRERFQWLKDGATAAFSTPILWTPPKGAVQVIVSGSYRIDAYAIDSGENVWWVGKQGTSPIATPVMLGDVVFAHNLGSDTPYYDPWEKMRGKLDRDKDGKLSFQEIQAHASYRDHFGWFDRDGDGFITAEEWEATQRESVSEHGLVAVRAGGSGDQTKEHLLWRYKKAIEMGASPLVYKGVLYYVRTGGIITSLDPATGDVFKMGRARDALGVYYASPVAADGKIYLASMEGKVNVLRAGAQWEILAVNDLEEDCQATPAIGDGCIYFRTARAVYCFRNKR